MGAGVFLQNSGVSSLKQAPITAGAEAEGEATAAVAAAAAPANAAAEAAAAPEAVGTGEAGDQEQQAALGREGSRRARWAGRS